jgi:hypothetical protein
MKYHKVTVTMKTGFKYSYTCIGRMLEGMKASSSGYWTEKIEVVDITEEEHRAAWATEFEPEKKRRTPQKKVEPPAVSPSPKKDSTKKKPKLSSLQDFFQ